MIGEMTMSKRNKRDNMNVQLLEFKTIEHVCNITVIFDINPEHLAEGLCFVQELKDRWDEIFDSAMKKISKRRDNNE
jgi:hypothetical protein